MQTVTVAKKFEFHAAHRLPHHDGQCRRLHGHTYGLEVVVTGPLVNPEGAPDEGMLMDFSVLKDMYKMLIEPHVEHQHLNETLASPALEVRYPLWTDIREGEPITWGIEPLTTAEGLALWCHQSFEYGLFKLQNYNPTLVQVQVTVWETPTSYVRVGTSWQDRSIG